MSKKLGYIRTYDEKTGDPVRDNDARRTNRALSKRTHDFMSTPGWETPRKSKKIIKRKMYPAAARALSRSPYS